MTARHGGTDAQSAPTAKQVAARAGVSVTTVSRVLNGHAEAIPRDTQNRVLAAAKHLRYRPNSLAVSLRKGSTHTIGLIVPDIADAYFHQVARGVEDVAQAAGYMVIIANTDRVRDKEEACVDLLLDKRIDGAIFAGGGVDGDTHLINRDWGATDVVTIGPHELQCPSVMVDDTAAIATAVRHLADVSCSRVLCLAGRPNWLVTQRRLTGYREAVADTGLACDERLVRFDEFSQSAGARMTREALDESVDFDGIVAFNDYLAIGAMRVLADTGLRVPDDVAVVGCDDIPVSELVHPALTSINFSQYEFGRVAARMLLDGEADQQEVVMFPHQLTRRASTARRATHGVREPPGSGG